MITQQEHYCQSIETFDLNKFFQKGSGKGVSVLIVGESPAENGWRKSGKACYTPEGKLLPTGKRLNELLEPFGLSVETCGFTELAKCFVGKDRYLLSQCAQGCWPIFIRQLKNSSTKLIILLGIKTLEIFNKLNKTSIEVGTINKIKIEESEYNILPIFHPSPINPHGRARNKKIFTETQNLIETIINGQAFG